MVINRLRQETKDVHAALERKIIPSLKQISSIADYQQVLKLFYGYFKPLESLVLLHIDRTMIVDIDKRRKADLLHYDLQQTGSGEVEAVAKINELPIIADPYSALGALYVMEGSTLGGAIISKMIRQRLHETSVSIRFFEGYGESSSAMWESFLNQLNAVPYSPENEERLIATAKETFQRFEDWATSFTNQIKSSNESAQRA